MPQGYGFSSGGLHPLPVSVPVPIGALKHMQRRGVGGGMGTPPMLGLGGGGEWEPYHDSMASVAIAAGGGTGGGQGAPASPHPAVGPPPVLVYPPILLHPLTLLHPTTQPRGGGSVSGKAPTPQLRVSGAVGGSGNLCVCVCVSQEEKGISSVRRL